LSRTQAELGHDVSIFSISNKPPLPVAGCEVRSYPVRRFPLPIKNRRLRDIIRNRSPFNLPPELVSDLIDWRPTIVHFHFVHLPQAIRLARKVAKHGIPYCVTLNGGLAVQAQQRNRLGKRLFGLLFERSYLNRAAFLHAISEAEVEGARAYGVHNRFITAPNCIDPSVIPDQLDPDFIRHRIEGASGRRVFLYLGRLDPEQKGLDMLLDAWSRISSRNRLALVMAGPDWRYGRSRLQVLAEELRVSESVWFMDPVSGREKWDVLASADVFVHPSRWEGMSFAVLEAMLLAKPVLLTPASDPDGIVARTGAGVVGSPDVEGIWAALRELADADERRLIDLGQAVHELVGRRFRWERTAQILLDGYTEVIPRH
jgi:glycosyltransferase involved in cell wall biosynthesis